MFIISDADVDVSPTDLSTAVPKNLIRAGSAWK